MNGLTTRNRKALVAQLYEMLNRYEFTTAATLITPPTAEMCLTYWLDLQRTFPDMSLEPLTLIAEDEWIAVHFLFRGTHCGVAKLPHHGKLLVGAEPTGRTVAVEQVCVYQAVAGKLRELYSVRDDLSLYQQLSLLPSFDEESLKTSSSLRA
jgi:predicted ester cyclase